MLANPSRPWGAASDASQEATWCERGQINATEMTVTRDRCFLNNTHHTHTNILAYYIRPVANLLPQLCLRLSQTSSPRTHTYASSDRRGGVGRTSRPRRTEDRHARRQAWQHAGNSREQWLLFSLLFPALNFHFGQNRYETNSGEM